MILLNDFGRQWAETKADVLGAVDQVGSSGWYVLGQRVKDFEKHLAQWWGIENAVGVANGLDGIEIALKALGCGAGDVVLTSPISAFATPLAILKLGATPVFVDCDEFGLIDLKECRRVLAARPEIRYFVPVHLYGHSLDMGELAALKQDFDLGMVEDCAQSIGASHLELACGTVGQYAATSFYPTKNLGALGDGGAVLCRDGAHSDKIRQLRDYGQTSKYKHDLLGYNSRLDELQAAILDSAFLPRLSQWTSRRREIAAAYLKGIKNPLIQLTGSPQGVQSVWHLFPVLLPEGRKPEAMAYFKAAGVAVGEHYPMALIEQKALDSWQGKLGSDCARSIEFCRRELSLPIHPYLSDDEVAEVIRVANGWS